MQNPPLAEDDLRLDALRRYRVQDTVPPDAFADLTRLAAQWCRAPISLVCFVGRNLQWFRSAIGVELTDEQDHLPCAFYQVLQPEPLVVSSATSDDRFDDRPFVTGDMAIRSLASAPLVTPDGHRIGALLVLDRVSRTFDESQAEILAALARQAMVSLELLRVQHELAAASPEPTAPPAGADQDIYWAQFEQSRLIQLVADLGSGLVEVANRAACDFVGLSPRQIGGRTIAELGLLPPGSPIGDLGHNATSWRFRYRHPTGDVRDMEAYAAAVELQGRRMLSLVVRDITLQQRLEYELSNVLTHARCILWTADVRQHGGRITWWQRITDTDAAMQILPLEIRPGEDYARAWFLSRHPDDRDKMDGAGDRAVLDGRTSYSQEFRCCDKYDQIHWLHEDVSLRASEQGRWFAVGICTDITARKRAEEERAAHIRAEAARAESEEARHRLAFMLETSTLLSMTLEYEHVVGRLAEQVATDLADICLIDMLEEDGALHRRAARHRDPDRQPLTDRLQMHYAPDLQSAHPIMSVLRTGRSEVSPEMSEEFLRRTCRNDDHYRIVQALGFQSFMCVPLLARGHVLGALTLISTDPGRRYGESDLAMVEDLAKRAAITVDNVRLYLRLQRADRSKDEFLAMLAHELRNPLAPILNALHILRTQSQPELVDQAREILGRQVHHMTRLVDDLLDVSRITRGKIVLKPDPLDITSLVRATVEDHRPTMAQAGLTLTLEAPHEPIWLVGDSTRLAQVLGNLLHNATKFTEAGGQVSVRLELSPNDRRVMITVRDTGIGIDSEMLPVLFEPFTQADRSLARSRGGLGLGLALVKGWVELHGGRVSVRSEGPGKGAEFRIWIPTAPHPQPRPG